MDEIYVDNCKETIEKIMNSAINANHTYLLFRQLRDLLKNEPDLFDLSRAFYNRVMYNCIQVIFIELCKMYDYDTNSCGIRSLQNRMKSNISKLDNNTQIESVEFSGFQSSSGLCVRFRNLEEMINDSQSKIKNKETLLDRVWTLRDKYYAHYDLTVPDIDMLFKDNEVKYAELGDLLLLNINLCNRVYMYFNNKTLYPSYTNCDDFKKTIYYVKKGTEACEL